MRRPSTGSAVVNVFNRRRELYFSQLVPPFNRRPFTTRSELFGNNYCTIAEGNLPTEGFQPQRLLVLN